MLTDYTGPTTTQTQSAEREQQRSISHAKSERKRVDPSSQSPDDEAVIAMSEADMQLLNSKLERAAEDIEEIRADIKSLLAWRWMVTGAVGLISLFGLSVCGFVAWSLWNDNTRLVTIEDNQRTESDYPVWKAKVDQRLEAIEEKEIKHGK